MGAALLARLDDSEWFVRVHAARAAGHVLGAEAAPTARATARRRAWWVRTAAKDALRGMGADAVPSLLAILAHEDLFARNGQLRCSRTSGSSTSSHSTVQAARSSSGSTRQADEKLREAAEARVGRRPAERRSRGRVTGTVLTVLVLVLRLLCRPISLLTTLVARSRSSSSGAIRERRSRSSRRRAPTTTTLGASRFTIPVSVIVAAYNEETASCRRCDRCSGSTTPSTR